MEAAHYEQADLWGEDHVFEPEHQIPKFEAVAGLLSATVTRSLVDVGAGDGRLLRYLVDHEADAFMVAAERSRAAIRHVERPGAQASIDALPFKDKAFSVAVCCEVLEHLPPTIFDRARAELGRVARDSVIVTVPNRENRARSNITCEACGCRYNPDRHLRSFSRTNLDELLNDFVVDDIVETGPHQPMYPRFARLWLERAGLLQRPGSPSCPQCGTLYRFAAPIIRDPNPEARREGGNGSQGIARRGYDVARRLVPKARHPYYLCARFRRVR